MWTTFTDTGKLRMVHNNPAIFPATQEWYDKLVHVYPNLERPVKSPREIILAMRESGWKMVPCRVSDVSQEQCEISSVYDYARGIKEGDSPIATTCTSWAFARPVDPKTGKNKFDFINGEMILED